MESLPIVMGIVSGELGGVEVRGVMFWCLLVGVRRARCQVILKWRGKIGAIMSPCELHFCRIATSRRSYPVAFGEASRGCSLSIVGQFSS